MKTRINWAAALKLLSAILLVTATVLSPEVSAQGGRAESRGKVSTGVERGRTNQPVASRQRARKQDSRVARRPADNTKKAVVRSRAAQAKTSKAPVKRSTKAGRSAATVDKNRGNVASRTRSRTEQSRTTEDRTRSRTVRDRASGRGSASGGRVAGERDRGTRTVTGDRGNRVTGDRNRQSRTIDGNRRPGTRSAYEGDRRTGANRHYEPVKFKKRRPLYQHNRRHRSAYSWCTIYHHPGHHHYINADVHIGSHLYVGVRWPWRARYQHHWRPRYRYSQVVYVDVGWGRERRRNRVDVRTYYRQRVLQANDYFAEVEIEIDAIDLYQNDRYLGTVERIPGSLSKVRAKIFDNGSIEFDRDIFLVGEAGSGFEVISTRHYSDYLYNAYDRGHGYKAGRVDLRNGRVKKVRHSRFFDPGNAGPYVPVSLLPDDDRLWDYGSRLMDGSRPQGYNDGEWYRNHRDDDFYGSIDENDGLSREFDVSYQTPQGADIRMQSSTRLERLD